MLVSFVWLKTEFFLCSCKSSFTCLGFLSLWSLSTISRLYACVILEKKREKNPLVATKIHDLKNTFALLLPENFFFYCIFLKSCLQTYKCALQGHGCKVTRSIKKRIPWHLDSNVEGKWLWISITSLNFFVSWNYSHVWGSCLYGSAIIAIGIDKWRRVIEADKVGGGTVSAKAEKSTLLVIRHGCQGNVAWKKFSSVIAWNLEAQA